MGLSSLGYATLEAVDCPSGLCVLQSDVRADLLTTDVGLPGSPGLNRPHVADAARRLRPDLKLLFITGYAHNAAIGNGVPEPRIEMLSKLFALNPLGPRSGRCSKADAPAPQIGIRMISW